MVYIFSNEELREKVDDIPQHTYAALYAMETSEIIREVCKKYEVASENTYIVAEEILYILLQLTSVPEMISRLTERTELSSSQVEKMVADLREELLNEHDILTKPADSQRGGASAHNARDPEDSFLPHSVVHDEESEPDTDPHKEKKSSVPSYSKPLTDIPRYDDVYNDPYHEKPK